MPRTGSDGRSWLREPLLHFVVLGGLLFGVVQWRQGDDPDANTIVVDADERARLSARFEEKQGRPPTDEEARRLVDAWVDAQLLYREGLSLGLDRGDPVIRRRIVEKMRFVAAEQAVVDAPDDAKLEAFVDEHAERYAGPPRRDFTLVTFGGDDAEALAAEARDKLVAGAAPRDVGGRVATGKRFTPSNTRGTYGAKIAEAVQSATPNEWTLVDLGTGWSVLHVGPPTQSERPPLSKVRKQATLDWAEAQKKAAVQERVEALRERYRVVTQP
ncbi:MAG: peptidylprolyl isomerase [Myxococcota bacterium]